MKSTFLLVALLAIVSISSAQWSLDCNTASTLGSSTHGILQMRAAGSPHSQCFYMVDSLHLKIFEDPCAQTPTWQYTFNTNERTAYYRYVYTTPVDFTGDGINEILLMTYYLVGNNARSAVKIFDITNGTVLLDRRDPNLTITAYPYNIADINGDGMVECVVSISNPQTATAYSEIYNTGVSATSTTGNNPRAPADFTLEQNYPNPFNPATRIDYSIAAPGNVSVEVFNIAGQRVATLGSGYQTPGEHSVEWNSRDGHGIPLSSGTYLYEVSIDGKPSGTRRMILLR